MPLLGNFAAQSNNRKKKRSACVSVLCLSRLFNLVYLSTCSSIFCFFWDRQQSSEGWFVRSMPAHRTTTDEPAVDDASSDTVHVHQKCSPDRTKEKPKRVPWDVRPPFDVSWCCVTGFYRPELVESVNRSERTRGCGPATALFCFLNLKTMAGCRWKNNSYKRDREKKMHGPLLILAFCWGGWGGGGARLKKKLSKGSVWQKCGWLGVRSWRWNKSFALRVLLRRLDEIHHHKDFFFFSMTDLTRPGSLPCEELQSYPSSKRREKAKFALPRKSGKIS